MRSRSIRRRATSASAASSGKGQTMSKQISPEDRGEMDNGDGALSRRRMLLAGTALAASVSGGAAVAQAQPTPPPRPAAPSGAKPNIIAIFGRCRSDQYQRLFFRPRG